MIPREVKGPEANTERAGPQLTRDIRPGSVRFLQALQTPLSGFLLIAGGVGSFFAPVILDPVVVLAVIIATYVLTRPTILPMRLPSYARGRDRNHPSPRDRSPQKPAGIFYLGADFRTGQQIWLTNEDCRQHGVVPGTTGAGKTYTLVSMVANSLIHGSGFIFVDGKADNSLYAMLYSQARRFNREDDVVALNFLVASGNRDTNTFNPFASCNADVLRELLVSQIERNPQGGANDPNGVFLSRAVALLGALAPVLVWLRDNRNIPIDIEKIRLATELRSVIALALHSKYRLRDPEAGTFTEIDLKEEPAIPPAYLFPLQAYLGETGGFDVGSFGKDSSAAKIEEALRRSDEPARQHSFAVMHFSQTFTQMAVSLGHIFKVESSDIDMRDIVLNRRILAVNLPTLENSGESTAALGKIVVATLRNMMAQTLGADLEGNFDDIIANNAAESATPFPVIFDEVGYYAVTSMDKMMAMGRKLGLFFLLGFQEIVALKVRMGESALSMLGNANLQIITRLQEGSETRSYIEKTAGDTYVTQASRFDATGLGGYSEGMQAEVRQVSRVDWQDVRGLIEGEAIMLYGRFRVYAKTFDAEPKAQGALRINRPLALLPAAKQSGVTRDGWVQAALTALQDDRPVAAEPGGPFEAIIRSLEPAIKAVMVKTGSGELVGEAGDTAIGDAITAALADLDPDMRAPGIYYQAFQVFPRMPDDEKEGDERKRPRYDLKRFMLQRSVIHRDDAKTAEGKPVDGAASDQLSLPAGRNLMTLIPDEELRIQAALGGISVRDYLISLDYLIETFRQAIPPSGSTEQGDAVAMAAPPIPPTQHRATTDDPAASDAREAGQGEAGQGVQDAAAPGQDAPVGSPVLNGGTGEDQSKPAPDDATATQRRFSPGR
ncbi:type IV secretory system conjugative DNA transfer family protein [Acidiphilium acidophilum]|uniref:Type IV secretion system DNA-binding domain-containing protein n=1 Tax=Acidiphilium acidophilum TaxID=76588 RepID=A0AAW9DMC9_ACIAO|nr:type IV secretion system DNA-binding domain-containing protein [Acidiphilium acidophilum]MDX5929202.1 type IV secretion system DNA-binding domain-containing protein [Acidiphilium acidophilum]